MRLASRFNSGTPLLPSYEIFYLAESPVVALQEAKVVVGPPSEHIANPRHSDYRTFDVEVRLQGVADLTKSTQQGLLATTRQELTGNWDSYPVGLAPTQRLGDALFATPNLEAFLTVSAAMPTHKNLVVFPKKLRRGSRVRFEDVITGTVHTIRPASKRN